MRALIIFEMVPESTVFVTVENPTKQELQVIKEAAGQFINSSDDTEAVDQISEWMAGKWKEFSADEVYLFEGPFDLVVLCGFIL
jgi:hypothetical protein